MKKKSNDRSVMFVVLMLVIFLLMLYANGIAESRLKADIPYNEFKALISEGEVREVKLSANFVAARLRKLSSVSTSEKQVDTVLTNVPEFGDPELLPLLEQHNVVTFVKRQDEGSSIWNILLGMLPFLLFIGLYFMVLGRMQPGMGQNNRISSFLKPKSEIDDSPPSTTFDDVAGQESATAEVSELLDYIRDPERYRRLGAGVPKGVLLMGSPGTGKTLLARALAGEAGVPFCSISASEFIEMIVGVGAARVRALFKQAREKAPAIIFIDELDAVSRVRGTGLGGGNDEREQTLNQILSEMDGFIGHEAVIVLAATNRPDVLDPALLRPGRFDRHVTLELPDLSAREAILRVHTRDTPLDEDVSLHDIAAETPGFSGADLKNLVNEAAMNAAKNQQEKLVMQDFEKMRDKVIFGSERSIVIPADERHRLAVHEAGHTAAAHYSANSDPIHKVSIIPRGQALGATQQLPENERYTLSEPYLHDRLCVLLAGRAAEKHYLDNYSSGADGDIKQATALAKAMVTRLGMSYEVGPIDLRETDDHPFLGREITKPRTHSDISAEMADRAVRELLQNAEDRARRLIADHHVNIQSLVATRDTRNIRAILNKATTRG